MRTIKKILNTNSGEPQNQEEEILLDSYITQMKDYYKQQHLTKHDRAAIRRTEKREASKKVFISQHRRKGNWRTTDTEV